VPKADEGLFSPKVKAIGGPLSAIANAIFASA